VLFVCRPWSAATFAPQHGCTWLCISCTCAGHQASNHVCAVCPAPVGGVGVDDVVQGGGRWRARVCLAAAVPVQAGLTLSGGELLRHAWRTRVCCRQSCSSQQHEQQYIVNI
jgi:hypothetical protein